MKQILGEEEDIWIADPLPVESIILWSAKNPDMI
jgi:hypothetical protein